MEQDFEDKFCKVCHSYLTDSCITRTVDGKPMRFCCKGCEEKYLEERDE